MKKINVVGTSGSGKSTFARMLANQLNAPYIEMDALHWLPEWRSKDMQNIRFIRIRSPMEASALLASLEKTISRSGE